MAKRRGHGEGSIYLRPDGRWCAYVTVGQVKGKQKRKYIYGKTRKEVAEKLKAALRDQQLGVNIAPERLTVETFLTTWLEEVVRRRLRPRVYENYEQIVRMHLVPHLGSVQLVKLMPEQVYAVLAQLADEGKAANTIRNVRAVLRRALNQALRWGKVTRNVATLVELPKPANGSGADSASVPHAREMSMLSPAQAQLLLDTVASHRWAVVYRVALELGLRRGEILALRWADIDFDRMVLAVTGTMHRHSGKLHRDAPKTESSRRLLPLTDTLVAALLKHKLRQDTERHMLGDGWVDRDLVFTTGHGTAIEPHNLFDHFKAALQKAGLPEIRFHDLRHSCASILLAQNVHPRVIMEILGHSEIGTTMNLYAHVIPEVQESAVQLLSQALAPKAKLAQIEYTRYDAQGRLIDSGTLEREGELALMARLSPKGWTLNARLIAQDGQVEERVYICGKVE
jgi:integrase